MKKFAISVEPLEADSVYALGFSPNSRFLSVAQEGLACLIDLQQREVVSTTKVPGNRSQATRPVSSGAGLVAGEKAVSFFPVPKGKRLAFKGKHKSAAVAIDFNASENRVLTVAASNIKADRARVHDANTGDLLGEFTAKKWARLDAGVFVDDDEIAVLDAAYTYRRWNIASGELLTTRSLQLDGDPDEWQLRDYPGALSGDGSLALNLIVDDEVVLWNTDDGALVWRAPGRQLAAMDSAGEKILTQNGGELMLHDRTQDRVTGLGAQVASKRAGISPDGRYVVGVGWEGNSVDVVDTAN